MTPRYGGFVDTPLGLARYHGRTQPYGFALVETKDGTFHYCDPKQVRALRVGGVVKARDLIDFRVAHMLAVPASAKEGNQ